MNKKLLALLVVAVVGLPMAAAASTIENHGVVTGHTTYVDMGGFDPNIAAIAGLAESKVVWFNGKTIFSSTGTGFVYAVGSDVPCSPLDGRNYRFQHYNLSYIDPNDQPHIVGEYTYECDLGIGNGLDFVDQTLTQTITNSTPQYHVWITLTHAKIRDGPIQIQGNIAPGGGDAGRWYNFALAVDTREMTREDGDVSHTGEGGRTTDEINEGDSYCESDVPEGDHVCNEGSVDGEDTPHEHNSATVDLYFAKNDRGIGAKNSSGGNHPGTDAGCDFDTYCNGVKTGTYTDPTSSSNTTA